MTAKCEDCDRPYGCESGFPDLLIPFEAWRTISTNGDDTGLLCPSCICARLYRAGLRSVPCSFAGDAVESVAYETMREIRRTENEA